MIEYDKNVKKGWVI